MADRVGRLALLAMGEVGKEDALRFPARGLLAARLSLSFLLATASSGRAASPTATTTVAAVRCGDVNGDGIVDVGDALVVAQFDVGLRQCSQLTQPEACDVNGGGANASPRSFRLTIPLTVLPTRQPHHDLNSVPGGIRTHVTGVKGRCPRPG